MRGRPGTTVLAALAVLVAAAPIIGLVRTSHWYAAAMLAVAAVAVTGWLGRVLRGHGLLVVLVQALVAHVVITLRLGIGGGPLGLPGTDVLTTTAELVREGIATIQRYAAPAPEKPGLALLLAGLVAVVAILVDHLAAARRAPAATGFPLLVLFLVAAVNTAEPLPWHWFAALAGAWLLLIVADTTRSVRAYAAAHVAPSSLHSASGSDAAESFAWRSRALALGAIVLALVGQSLLPAPQTRFLTEGLGRGDGSGGGGAVSFRSDVDISRDLTRPDAGTVLTFTTTQTVPAPIAVATAVRYEGGHWTLASGEGTTTLMGGADTPPGREVVGPTAPTKRHTLTVRDSRVAAPQVASTGWPLRVSVPSTVRTATGDIRSDSPLANYAVTYETPEPRASDLAATFTEPPPVDRATLEVPADSRAAVTRAARAAIEDPRSAATGRPGTPYHAAMAIQEHLRNGDYYYSLTLDAAPQGADGRALDPVSAFLATQRGYCVQFATAMTLMARSQGIPARVRLGFLPGEGGKEGINRVRRSDAHMWPELYLPGSGWTRFEPTPSGRSGEVPAYAQAPERAPAPTATERETAAPSPTVAPSAAPATPESDDSGAGLPGLSLLRAALPWLLGALVLAALLGAVPLLARRVRRRRLEAAGSPAERLEAQWLTLRERLADLGVHLDDTDTPRQAAAAVSRDSSLPVDARERLAAALGSLEAARYAPPGSALPDLRERELLAGIGPTRPWTTRLRAMLLPTTGLTAVRAAARRATPGR